MEGLSHAYTCIPSPSSPPSRLPLNIEQSSLCYYRRTLLAICFFHTFYIPDLSVFQTRRHTEVKEPHQDHQGLLKLEVFKKTLQNSTWSRNAGFPFTLTLRALPLHGSCEGFLVCSGMPCGRLFSWDAHGPSGPHTRALGFSPTPAMTVLVAHSDGRSSVVLLSC